MGKSSLVKAIHGQVVAEGHAQDRGDPARGPALDRAAPGASEGAAARFLLFCDDLSFSHDDQHYKSLKAVLDGGIEGRPENVVFYATSNRRHLMPRDMIENERSSAINPSEAVEEKVSLSDRFGLWLGFHPCSQDDYLAMIRGYCDAWGVAIDDATLCARRRSNGRRRAGRGRAGWPGSTSPTSPGAGACGSAGRRVTRGRRGRAAPRTRGRAPPPGVFLQDPAR
jgi:uncharacterized protein